MARRKSDTSFQFRKGHPALVLCNRPTINKQRRLVFILHGSTKPDRVRPTTFIAAIKLYLNAYFLILLKVITLVIFWLLRSFYWFSNK